MYVSVRVLDYYWTGLVSTCTSTSIHPLSSWDGTRASHPTDRPHHAARRPVQRGEMTGGGRGRGNICAADRAAAGPSTTGVPVSPASAACPTGGPTRPG